VTCATPGANSVEPADARDETTRMATRARVTGALLSVALVASLGVATGVAPAGAQAVPSRHGLGLRVTAASLAAYRSAASRATELRAQGGGSPPPLVDLTRWAPPPGNQGQVSSCVSWAIDYTAMGWYLRRQHVDGFPLAPMYTYAQLVHGQNVGTTFWDTFAIAKAQGVDDQADYTQGDQNFTSQPSATEQENASNWKLASYQALPVSKSAIEGALASGTPVVLGMEVFEPFFYLDQTAGYFDTRAAHTYDGHAVTALGYNSKGVEIENSWGTDWGHHGFVWLSWHFVTTYVFEAYALGPLNVTPVTAPHVSAVGPSTGTSTGGQQVTITGTNFDPSATVTFGGVPASNVQVDPSGTSIVATTPPHSPGPATVNVTGDNGRSPTWAKTLYQFIGAPRPTAVSPNQGPYRGGTRVVIVGSRLNGASVKIGDTRVKVLSATSSRLVIAAPSGRRGTHAALTLSNAAGSVRAANFTWT
jgi:hypothetical protein